MTELVHGAEETRKAITKSAFLFDSDTSHLRASDIEEAFRGDNRMVYLDRALLNDVVALSVASGALPSKSATNKMIRSGGLYVNKIKWTAEMGKQVNESFMIEQKIVLLRTGKSNYRIIVMTDQK